MRSAVPETTTGSATAGRNRRATSATPIEVPSGQADTAANRPLSTASTRGAGGPSGGSMVTTAIANRPSGSAWRVAASSVAAGTGATGTTRDAPSSVAA